MIETVGAAGTPAAPTPSGPVVVPTDRPQRVAATQAAAVTSRAMSAA